MKAGTWRAASAYSPVPISESHVQEEEEEEDHSDFIIGFGIATSMLLLVCITVAVMVLGLSIYDYTLVQMYSPLVIEPSSDQNHAVKPCLWPAQTSPASENDFLCPSNGYTTIDYYCPKHYTCDTLDVPYCHAKNFQCEEEVASCLSLLSDFMFTTDLPEIDMDTLPNYSIYLQVAGVIILALCVIFYIIIAAAVWFDFQHGLIAFSLTYVTVNIGTDLLFIGGMVFSYTSKDLCNFQCFDPSTNQILAMMCSLQGAIFLLSIVSSH